MHLRFAYLLSIVQVGKQSIFFFKKNGPFLASFSLFLSFQYTVDSKQMFDINKFLPMTGFEPWISGIGSDRSTNWATTTSQKQSILPDSLCFSGVVILIRFQPNLPWQDFNVQLEPRQSWFEPFSIECSVTRCWNYKGLKSFHKLPKNELQHFYLESYVCQIRPQKSPNKATFVRKFYP